MGQGNDATLMERKPIPGQTLGAFDASTVKPAAAPAPAPAATPTPVAAKKTPIAPKFNANDFLTGAWKTSAYWGL